MEAMKKIKGIFEEYMGADASGITQATTIKELKIDSLDMVEIVMAVEEAFDIAIDDPSVIVTVGDLAALVTEAKK